MAELLVAKHDGQVAVRVPLDDRRKLTLGRSHRCDLRLDSSSISRRHALLFEYESQWHLVDTGSRTGIHCELEQVPHVVLHDDRWARIGPAYLWLRDGDDVAPAAPVRPPIRPNALGFEDDDAAGAGPKLVLADSTRSALERYSLEGVDLVTIGRSPRCDVVLGDTQISRLHCVLYTEHRGWCVADAGSGAGTRVEGRMTRRRVLRPERLIRIGTSLLWIEAATTVDGEDAGRPYAAITAESAFFDEPEDLALPGGAEQAPGTGAAGRPARPSTGGERA